MLLSTAGSGEAVRPIACKETEGHGSGTSTVFFTISSSGCGLIEHVRIGVKIRLKCPCYTTLTRARLSALGTGGFKAPTVKDKITARRPGSITSVAAAAIDLIGIAAGTHFGTVEEQRIVFILLQTFSAFGSVPD